MITNYNTIANELIRKNDQTARGNGWLPQTEKPIQVWYMVDKRDVYTRVYTTTTRKCNQKLSHNSISSMEIVCGSKWITLLGGGTKNETTVFTAAMLSKLHR